MLSSIKEAKVEFEKAFVEKKLREFKGNISQTAEAMGIERSNLHKKIKAFGLNGFRSQ
jgi:two-component system nitrogen regulation response regulator NtrX